MLYLSKYVPLVALQTQLSAISQTFTSAICDFFPSWENTHKIKQYPHRTNQQPHPIKKHNLKNYKSLFYL